MDGDQDGQKRLRGWMAAGRDRPEGFTGAAWHNPPTKTMRVPVLMIDALAAIAREADKQPDPIAYLESLRPGGAPPAPTAPPPPVDGDIAAMNVAQLRKLAAARGMAGAARANKSALLEFLG